MLSKLKSFSAYRQLVVKTQDCEITFANHNTGFDITIRTPRVILKNINAQDFANCCKLYGDPEVMGTFHDGKIRSPEVIKQKYFTYWEKLSTNKDAFLTFTGYALDKAERSSDFIGIVSLDHCSENRPELAGLIMKEYWGNGYTQEGLNAVLNNYLPLALLLGYHAETKQGEFNSVGATSRTNNPAMQKILEKFMQLAGTPTAIHGAARQAYFIDKETLLKNLQLRQPVLISSELTA